MRCPFKDGLTTTLEDELKAVKDHLDIQDIRYRTHSVMNEEIPESLPSFQLPPVLLLAFVENAVKHAMGDLSELVVSIRAGSFQKDGVQFAWISVTGNRSTFSAKTLDSLNAAEPESGGSYERHLGIWNVRRRLSLMYGDTLSVCI